MAASSETGREAIAAAEFRLALECCRHGFQGPVDPRKIAICNIEWRRFLQLARFHRIEGLAWNCLADAPELPLATSKALKQAASTIAAENLRAAAESHLLLARFEAAKIPLLFLKGLTLGALAYRSPAIKSAVDMDVLIRPEDLGKVARLLRECGYRLVFPKDAKCLHRWHRTHKESDWIKDSSLLRLDLHTRAADNPRLIATTTAGSSSRRVEIGDGIALPTLADDELFAYLAVHGASSAWFRLKWISDFAGFLHGRAPGEIERLYQRSQELSAGRAAGQGLLLADALFGTLRHSESLRRELASDPKIRLLSGTASRQVTGEPSEPTQRWLGTWAIHWTQFFLLPGFSYRRSEFLGQLERMLSHL